MQIKSLFGLSSFPLTMLLFLAPIVLLCPTSLGAVRKVHEVNVHTWSDADGAIICIFSHFLLHKKQGIFSDSADLVKLLYYSLPGVEGKFQCLFYDQSWFINNFDHVYFLWHTKVNRFKKSSAESLSQLFHVNRSVDYNVQCILLLNTWIKVAQFKVSRKWSVYRQFDTQHLFEAPLRDLYLLIQNRLNASLVPILRLFKYFKNKKYVKTEERTVLACWFPKGQNQSRRQQLLNNSFTQIPHSSFFTGVLHGHLSDHLIRPISAQKIASRSIPDVFVNRKIPQCSRTCSQNNHLRADEIIRNLWASINVMNCNYIQYIFYFFVILSF